ncbi:hypothetical protein TNCV_1285351 [Trichonephila clavipes]|uniref:Uncharacterized protein n=1 Tax=Trichonephila clavipes TaxID=2585209 RepID=A0A8X6VQB2_TRICX|nr:hypothetical protein TNCV_1285351 [Trichonephila clavipes]
MFDSSSYDSPTPLAHADTSRDVLPTGELSFLPLRKKLGVKITCGNWYRLNDAALKRMPASGKCTRSANVEIPIPSPIREKKYYYAPVNWKCSSTD